MTTLDSITTTLDTLAALRADLSRLDRDIEDRAVVLRAMDAAREEAADRLDQVRRDRAKAESALLAVWNDRFAPTNGELPPPATTAFHPIEPGGQGDTPPPATAPAPSPPLLGSSSLSLRDLPPGTADALDDAHLATAIAHRQHPDPAVLRPASLFGTNWATAEFRQDEESITWVVLPLYSAASWEERFSTVPCVHHEPMISPAGVPLVPFSDRYHGVWVKTPGGVDLIVGPSSEAKTITEAKEQSAPVTDEEEEPDLVRPLEVAEQAELFPPVPPFGWERDLTGALVSPVQAPTPLPSPNWGDDPKGLLRQLLHDPAAEATWPKTWAVLRPLLEIAKGNSVGHEAGEAINRIDLAACMVTGEKYRGLEVYGIVRPAVIEMMRSEYLRDTYDKVRERFTPAPETTGDETPEPVTMTDLEPAPADSAPVRQRKPRSDKGKSRKPRVSADPPPGTPILDQYRQAKERHPAAIILFRDQAVYRAVSEDAEVLHRTLGLPFVWFEGLPAAAFPALSLETHLRTLLRSGQRVAVLDGAESKECKPGAHLSYDEWVGAGRPGAEPPARTSPAPDEPAPRPALVLSGSPSDPTKEQLDRSLFIGALGKGRDPGRPILVHPVTLQDRRWVCWGVAYATASTKWFLLPLHPKVEWAGETRLAPVLPAIGAEQEGVGRGLYAGLLVSVEGEEWVVGGSEEGVEVVLEKEEVKS